MNARDFYRLTGPTSWAELPKRYSHSSLTEIARCPRKWQLRRSEYRDLSHYPERPQSATLRGDIVHALLDDLFKAMALAGRPSRGTDGFRGAMRALRLRARAIEAVERAVEEWAAHPRGGRRPAELDVQGILNQTVEMFWSAYTPVDGPAFQRRAGSGRSPRSRAVDLPALLSARGSLTEQKVWHPSLPLMGTIDLVLHDPAGAIVADFKTGARRSHHLDQVRLYALLWWRQTGALPSRLEVRYPREIDRFPTDRPALVALEAELDARIQQVGLELAQRPAPARENEDCGRCGVRRFCDDYWTRAQPRSGRVDVELSVEEILSGSALRAQSAEGEVIVTYEAALGAAWGPFAVGDRLRALGAWRSADEELRLGEKTEVFFLV